MSGLHESKAPGNARPAGPAMGVLKESITENIPLSSESKGEKVR